MDEDISCLDISMNYAHGLEIQQSLKDIFDEGVGLRKIFFLSEMSFFEEMRQVSSVTELKDGVAVIGSPKVFEAGDYVGVSDLFDDIEFF